jgi:hypothetical protein
VINKELQLITEQDLKALVENAVREKNDIDYKRELTIETDADKKEFLADVSSLANAGGGDLIIGIIEDRATGEPNEVKGIVLDNVDKEIQRLDSMIREGISPRIPAQTICPIKLENGNYVLILRISQSWISPHRVIYKGSDKFYSRNSSGKYPLNVEELRSAFTLSETLRNKINNFRTERISKIIAGDTPVNCLDGSKIVLHLIPLISFNRTYHYDIKSVADSPSYRSLMYPINHAPNWFRYNIDGYITHTSGRDEKSFSYFQLYQNGIIEAVEAFMLAADNEKKIIPSDTFEDEIIKAVTRYLKLLQIMKVAVPIFIYLTLVGVKGYRYLIYTIHPFLDKFPIDKNILNLPEHIVENYSEKAPAILKSSFDVLWNASGFSEDNYYKAGEWNFPKHYL